MSSAATAACRREQTGRYYSEPQLDVRGTLAIESRLATVAGRAWLDHEWSDAYMDPAAVGWSNGKSRRRMARSAFALLDDQELDSRTSTGAIY